MRRRMALRHVFGVLFIGLLILGTVLSGPVAKAASWTNRAAHQGYFNSSDTAGSDSTECACGPVLYNNCYATDAISKSSVKTGTDVYNYLVNTYNNPQGNGGKWDKTGVSFIVNTMLGNDPDAAVKNITAAMWSDLQNRLEWSKLTVDIQSNVGPGDYNNYDTYYQYADDDVAWYSDNSSTNTSSCDSSNDLGDAMVFKDDTGTTRYVLLYACGNPIGNFSGGLKKPPQWTITPSISTPSYTRSVSPVTPALSTTEAIPGDTINWTHSVKNIGPDATDTDIAWRFNNYGTSPNATGSGGATTFAQPKANGATASFTSTYTPVDADLGTTYCRSTWAQPHAWNDANPIETGQQCVSIVYRYALTPVATIGGQLSTPAPPGKTGITVSLSVGNSGPTRSKPTAWSLQKCTYAPGVAVSSTAAPDSGSAAPTGGCGQIAGSSNVLFPKNTTTGLPNASNQSVDGNTPAGTHICYVLAVNPADWTSTLWRHSVPTCLSVTKSPKVQVWGGDLRAGSVETAGLNAPISGLYYGSWAEYGIFGSGPVSGMASNSAIAGGVPSVPSGTQLNTLTFANTPSPGSFEPYPPDKYFDAYSAIKTATTGSTSVGGPVANGTHSIILVNGTLTINSNITYSNSYADVASIPRVIYVVTGNIIVNAGVQQVDAWLITKGTLYTCSDDAGSSRINLTLTICPNRITFNGPVVASNIRLSRTYGADANSRDTPAEVFNLRPDVFLSTYNSTITDDNIQTVYEKELPPRW